MIETLRTGINRARGYLDTIEAYLNLFDSKTWEQVQKQSEPEPEPESQKMEVPFGEEEDFSLGWAKSQTTKVCPRCQKEFPRTEAHFYISPKGRVASYCHTCAQTYHQDYNLSKKMPVKKEPKKRGRKPVPRKVCPSCKKEYPLTEKYFRKNSRSKSGLGTYCKKCCQVRDNEYRARRKQPKQKQPKHSLDWMMHKPEKSSPASPVSPGLVIRKNGNKPEESQKDQNVHPGLQPIV